MRIVFKNVKLHNFMSYSDADVKLNRNGYVLVNGINNNPDDNAKSNGTGKSSLFSAISWALTGLTVSGSKEVANIHTEGTTSVELEFSVDNHVYTITRTKNPSNLKIFIDGEDKSGKGIRDTEKLLAEYLPDITHSLLNSVIILGQGLPQKFTNNSPSGRKDVLEKLSNSDFMISDLKARVDKRRTQLQNDIRDCENNITDLTARKEITTRRIESLNEELNSMTDDTINEYKIQIENLTNSVISCDKEINKYTELIYDLTSELNDVQEKITNSFNKYTNGKENLVLKDISNITDTIQSLSTEILSLNNEINKLDSITDICPTCGQKLPDVEKIDTTDKKEQLEKLNSEMIELMTKKKEIEEFNSETIKAYDDKFQEEQKKDKELLNTLSANLSNTQESKSKAEQNKRLFESNIDTINFKLNSFEETKHKLKNEIEIEKINNEEFIEKILYYNKNKDNLTEHLNVNTKMSTILKRDFRGYLLTNVIDFISIQAKEYSMDLFGTDKLDFYLDGNNIAITYDKKDYEVLSGGEKQKVDVIIQLAIRDMLCKFLNFSSNILVLDEITDSLDITGSQKMFNLISTKLNDVEAVYIVSHHQDFEIPVDSEITVVKGSDKISRIL